VRPVKNIVSQRRKKELLWRMSASDEVEGRNLCRPIHPMAGHRAATFQAVDSLATLARFAAPWRRESRQHQSQQASNEILTAHNVRMLGQYSNRSSDMVMRSMRPKQMSRQKLDVGRPTDRAAPESFTRIPRKTSVLQEKSGKSWC